jgi:hypothetical protein
VEQVHSSSGGELGAVPTMVPTGSGGSRPKAVSVTVPSGSSGDGSRVAPVMAPSGSGGGGHDAVPMGTKNAPEVTPDLNSVAKRTMMATGSSGSSPPRWCPDPRGCFRGRCGCCWWRHAQN